jgi:hypothetical protein
MLSEVVPAHVGILNDVIRTAISKNGTIPNDIGTVADAKRFPNIVVCDQHSDAAVFQKTHDALNFEDGNRVYPGEGFIQQDEAG